MADPGANKKAISAAFDKAGIETTEKRADRKKAVVVYGAHSLRHYFVTQATAAATLATTPPLLADATGDPLEALRGRILELAEGMNAKTWKAVKAELLSLAKAQTTA